MKTKSIILLSAGIIFTVSIFAVSPPLSIEGKGGNEWQTFDISIREFTISVYLNGVLVQDQLVIPEGERRIGTGTELGCWAGDGFHNDPGQSRSNRLKEYKGTQCILSMNHFK